MHTTHGVVVDNNRSVTDATKKNWGEVRRRPSSHYRTDLWYNEIVYQPSLSLHCSGFFLDVYRFSTIFRYIQFIYMFQSLTYREAFYELIQIPHTQRMQDTHTLDHNQWSTFGVDTILKLRRLGSEKKWRKTLTAAYLMKLSTHNITCTSGLFMRY